VAVINCKKAALRPLFRRCFAGGLGHVKDNADSVFIIAALDSLVRVGSIASYKAVCFRRKLCIFKILERILRVQRFFSV
jgi:hypothetical protein